MNEIFIEVYLDRFNEHYRALVGQTEAAAHGEDPTFEAATHYLQNLLGESIGLPLEVTSLLSTILAASVYAAYDIHKGYVGP